MAIVRGHWPAGKRRNKIDADLIGRVADVLRKRHTGTRPRGPKVSANGLASALVKPRLAKRPKITSGFSAKSRPDDVDNSCFTIVSCWRQLKE